MNAKETTEEQIKHVVDECARGRRPSEVVVGVGVSTRHVQRLYAKSRTSGAVHVRRRPRRPLSAPDWKAAARTDDPDLPPHERYMFVTNNPDLDVEEHAKRWASRRDTG